MGTMAEVKDHSGSVAVPSVPVIDFTAYSLDKAEPDQSKFNLLVDKIHEALTTIGFFYLENVGIPDEVIKSAFEVSKHFFTSSNEIKAKYKSGEWIRDSFHGYVPLDMEGLGPDSKRKDLKESFNIRPAIKETVYNKFPEIAEVPGMKAALCELFSYCRKLHQRVLEVMTKGLQLKDPMAILKNCQKIGTVNNPTTLRTLFYPAVESESERIDQVRCGEHTDYGAVTFLFQDASGGLEVQNVHGQWVTATPIEGTVLVNIGDLMQRWTSDVYIAAKHRVTFPSGSSKTLWNSPRQSIAFFGNPDDDAIIECLDGSGKYPPVSAPDYIYNRATESHSK